jgi:hypothetical protein
MKHFKVHLSVFLLAFGAVVTLVSFDTTTGRGQTQTAGKPSTGAVETGVKPTAAVRERGPEAVNEIIPVSSAFSSAAARNATLCTDLNWAFGGKQQRGWQLYSLLIGRLIDSEHVASSVDFASALSRWQEKSGLAPSGILDEETLYAMVSRWQSTRLKERGYASPDKLITAPISDFWDPARKEELRQVERETYAAYKRMVAAAAADKTLGLALDPNGQLAAGEKYLKILSAFRSREYQEKLRREFPQAGRGALAVNSPHFTGRALDLYVGGEPVEVKDSNRAIQVKTPVYRWLIRNAERFGFRPYYFEPWHWEYVGAPASKHQ